MKIITQYSNATNSPDYIAPIGAHKDNHSSEFYIKELIRIAGSDVFGYLDLGCAGGQSVVDVYEMGNIACGVDGGDLTKMLLGKHGVAENWSKYHDICLFKADITKPFELQDDNGELFKFDIITAWDVLEHPKENEIPGVIENIKKHLRETGVFIALVNTIPSSHHRCIKSEDWWAHMFEQRGFEKLNFDVNATPRDSNPPIIHKNDIGLKFRLRNEK